MSGTDNRPNVVWIMCDELRADAIGSYGNAHAAIRTPHIDSIGERGARFDRFYVNSPVCVSSRAAYKTGLLPTRSGVFHNEASFLPMAVEASSFTERFRAAGYTTVNLGKEHVPAELEAFDVSRKDGAEQMELMRTVGLLGDELGVTARAIGVHGATWPGGVDFPPDRLTDHAVQWLRNERPDNAPWLLRVSYLQPHTPVVVPEPWASRYDDQPWPDAFGPDAGLSDYERAFTIAVNSGSMTPEEIVVSQSRYHGLVAWLDDQVGRLLTTLDELDLRSNTIVAFVSDHGAQLGELGGAYGKMTFAAPSHHVPMMISWPGTLPAGSVRDDLGQAVDLRPTLLGLAGIDDKVGDGRDLFSAPEPDHILSAIGYGNPGAKPLPMVDRGEFPGGFGWPQRLCVRTDRWRYERSTRRDGELLTPEDHDAFLVDTHADRDEITNVIDDVAHAGVVTELEAVLADHLDGAVQTEPTVYAGWWAGFEARLREQWAI